MPCLLSFSPALCRLFGTEFCFCFFKVVYAAVGVKSNEDLAVLEMFPFSHFYSNKTVDKCIPFSGGVLSLVS